MPSCDDIPEHTIGRDNFDLFLDFLAASVPNRADRKTLAKCWSEQSKVPLTREMWIQVFAAGIIHHDL